MKDRQKVLPRPTGRVRTHVTRHQSNHRYASPSTLHARLQRGNSRRGRRAGSLGNRHRLSRSLRRVNDLQMTTNQGTFSRRPRVLGTRPTFNHRHGGTNRNRRTRATRLSRRRGRHLPGKHRLHPNVPRSRAYRANNANNDRRNVRRTRPATTTKGKRYRRRHSRHSRRRGTSTSSLHYATTRRPTTPAQYSLFPFRPRGLTPFYTKPPILRLRFVLRPYHT